YVRVLGGTESTVRGFRLTGLYASRLPSRYQSVCFSQLTSSRLGKSLRACAPRDSWRASADTIVAFAVSIRLSSSSASTRAVLKVLLLSRIATRCACSASSITLATPSERSAWLRNTPQWFCMFRRRWWATSCTDSPRVDASSCERRESARSEASFGNGLCEVG